VRIEAEVARALDHEFALGLTEGLLEVVELVPQRSVLRVCRPCPQAQVSVGERPVTTAGLTPAARVEGLGVVLRLAGAAPAGGGGVVPMRGGDVIAVGPVLGLHLP